MRTRPPASPPFGSRYSIFTIACLALGLAAASAAPDQETSAASRVQTSSPPAKEDPVAKSVVKIFTTVRYPDYFKPWNKLAPSSLVGSGVVIEGKRILTTAHVVLYANQVQVQANEAGDKLTATVVAVSPDMDLAVLKLDDESFFDSHPPLDRAPRLPKVTDVVMAYGFPTGGFSMSITKGIVSRIEFSRYNYNAVGLRIQVDAAINPGNSGGPAIVDGKMVGLTFAHLSQSENISYIIPCEEIDLFLKRTADGPYHGRPTVCLRLQALQNPALRSYLKVDRDVHGLVVQAIGQMPPDNPLRKWDIITRIGDAPLDDEGMIKLQDGPRVTYNYLIESTASNGKVPLTVLREGKQMLLQVPIATNPTWAMPPLKGAYPSYFVYGPLVFSEASTDIASGLLYGRAAVFWMGRMIDQGNPMLRAMSDFPTSPDQRMVVITAFLSHKLTRGYEDPTGQVVKSINGIPIKNLGHLVQLLRDSKDPFLLIDFDGHPLTTDTLVFSRPEILAATEDILSDNSVRSRGSTDMMDIWNAK